MIAGVAGLILSFFQDAIWAERAGGRRRGGPVAEEERREVTPPRY